MSNELGGITNASIRDTIGNRSFAAAQLVIGSTTTRVTTTVAVPHVVNGIFQTAFGIVTNLDLLVQTIIGGRNAEILTNYVEMPALPALGVGDDPSVIKVYILAAKGDKAYVVEPDIDTAGDDDASYPLSCPKGFAPFGLIKIEQNPTSITGVAAFNLGVTALTGVTGQTVTFHDITACPATVADIIEV